VKEKRQKQFERTVQPRLGRGLLFIASERNDAPVKVVPYSICLSKIQTKAAAQPWLNNRSQVGFGGSG